MYKVRYNTDVIFQTDDIYVAHSFALNIAEANRMHIYLLNNIFSVADDLDGNTVSIAY